MTLFPGKHQQSHQLTVVGGSLVSGGVPRSGLLLTQSRVNEAQPQPTATPRLMFT